MSLHMPQSAAIRLPRQRTLAPEPPMTLPDRLSIDPKSPFFDAELLQQGVRIVFNGKERTDVNEYCISEGWVRVEAGNSKDRRGNPMTIKLKGAVEAFLPE